jgi:flagellar M-ring protein FliF
MVKRLRLPQGSLKRISLSVLVDQTLRWEGTGPKVKRILEPPSAEKLKKISDLVSVAVGLQTQRGDQLIVESLPFEATLHAEPPEGLVGPAAPAKGGEIVLPAWIPAPLRNLTILGGIGGGLALAIVLLIIFMRKKKAVVKADAPAALQPPGSTPTMPPPSLSGAKTLQEQLAEQEERKRQSELEALQALRLPEMTTKKSEVLSKHITEEAKKDPGAIAHILRTWLQEDTLAR